MKVSKTPFKGLLVVETDLFEDNRGWFTETYSKDKFCKQGKRRFTRQGLS